MNAQERFPSSEKGERRRRWDEIAARMESAPDKLEYPIDPGIKEGVVALNAFDIHTVASCEGHADRGPYAPRIDVEGQEAERLMRRWKEAKEKGESERKLKEIIAEIERKNLEERRKLLSRLEEFYRDRNTSFYRHLIVSGMARGWSRLESQGAELQKIENEDLRRERLAEYQDEMGAFTSFLKEKYFEEEGS